MGCRAFVRKIALAPVLLCKLALYESCVGASATPQGNEIRVSEENSLKIIHPNVTSINISWKLEDLGRFRALNRSGVLAGANFIALRRASFYCT